jgi:hypothetical protein
VIRIDIHPAWKTWFATEKKGSRHNSQRTDWPIRGSIPNFSPKAAIEAVRVKPPSVDDRLLGLLGGFGGGIPATGSSSSGDGGGGDILEHLEANRGWGAVQKRRTNAAQRSSPREGRSGGSGDNAPVARSGWVVEGMEVRRGARWC